MGARPSAGRAHPAALRAHVLHPEALLGLPPEDRRAAGSVPRLPHKVSQGRLLRFRACNQAIKRLVQLNERLRELTQKNCISKDKLYIFWKITLQM